jgi:endonuclease/exonuclease/phosphatase family metal-dependent hydrolase
MATVRLMTYNVRRCLGLGGRPSPERVAGVIARFDPDVVCLQELDVGRFRTGRADQPGQIARALRMDAQFHGAVRVAEEQFGTAVLSRLPMRKVRSAPLPTLLGMRLEPRAALWVELRAGGKLVHVINVHLGLTRGEREVQTDMLLGEEWLGHPECRAPRILCGDLNMTPRARAFRRIERVLRAAEAPEGARRFRTWPSLLPLVPLDHVFGSSDLKPRGVEVPRDGAVRLASDHLPVIVDYEL